ncbi:MAG: hypothetical protein ACI8UO_004882 [Verrucomicrobiales bacterium]|jgi:hypothetical protein
MPAPAKTAQLTPSPRPPSGARTIPLAKAPGSTPAPGGAKPLPKATVKLQKTQPMAKGAPTTNLRSPSGAADDEYEEYSYEYDEEAEAGLMPFAIIVLLLAVAALVVELLPKLGMFD